MSRNVIVTGGAGYIGAQTCKKLTSQGYTPIVVDNLINGHKSAIQWGPFYEVDILDKKNLLEVFYKHKPIAVIHFAAFAYVGESVNDPYKYYHNNVLGSLSLLEVMKECDCSLFVFSSTCAIYGPAQTFFIDESHPQNPINPYGQSKLMVEKILKDAAAAYNLRYVALRYFNATGADPSLDIGENHIPETHIIPLILQTAAGINKCFHIYGDNYDTPDGTCIRDYIHIDDLAQAHILSLEYLLANNVSLELNLGTGKGYSVKEVLTIANEVTNKKISSRIFPRRPGDPSRLVADSSKAFSILNWKAKYPDLHIQIEHAWKWLLKLEQTN